MTVSLTMACVWVMIAAFLAMLPGRFHWRAAYCLMAVGIPLVGWVTWQNGPVIGLLVLAAGVSVLRWPALYALRWIRATARGPAK